MSTARYIIGDTHDVTAAMPDGSVDLVLTSPPFLALRSYLPPDHPMKDREIGSEPDPATFLDTMLGLAAEWGRVLAPHGSIAVELGDTYAGSGGAGGDYGAEGMRGGQAKFKGSALADRKNKVLNESGQRLQQGPGWPLDKSLCLIPQLYAVALAWGINPLTGQPSPAGRWRVRNVVAWCRPNPAVGALGDKYRPATSYMTIATRARDRWFDLDAVRTEPTFTRAGGSRVDYGTADRESKKGDDGDARRIGNNPAGAPPLDHWWIDDEDVFTQDAWLVSTEAYKGSHYATWPRKLLTRPIESMCPRQVCTTCGEPRRRIVDNAGSPYPFTYHQGRNGGTTTGGVGGHTAVQNVTTIGWTDCGHDTWRNGVVFDPFAGSGTTLAVAVGHNRDAIGIDLDERNAELARERVGMFLEVEYPEAVA